MSGQPEQFGKWSEVLDYKARILYSQIASLQKGLAEEGAGDDLVETMCRPYVEMLKSMYAEDYPFAKAIEESDLVLFLEGPAIRRENPRVSVITGVFTRVRTQVANLAKAIAQLSDIAGRVPKEMDLGLSGFARGSLVLGFTLPSSSDTEGPQLNLLGEQDPYYQAAREAIRTMGIVTKHLTEAEPGEELSALIPDARVRDTALSAIRALSPTVRQGIESVKMAGNRLGDLSPGALTPAIREKVRRQLVHPVIGQEKATFDGDVREIDLDARRFELRHIENFEINDLRCSYVDKTDEEASAWLNKRVRVSGLVERDLRGKARLLDMATIKILC